MNYQAPVSGHAHSAQRLIATHMHTHKVLHIEQDGQGYARKLDVFLAFLCKLLDVVSRTWVVGDLEHACESVQTVAHSNVNGLTENAVSLFTVCNHLRVAATHVPA